VTATRVGATPYVAFALAWSAAFWGLSALTGGIGRYPGLLFFYLGGGGPLIAAVVLTHVRESPATRRDFWIRVVDPRRIGWPWLAAALLAHPLLVGLAVLSDIAFGGSAPSPASGISGPFGLASLMFFVFWFGPLPEEIGWRGFAQDRLQARMNAFQASMVLGVVWGLWHVPLFFIEGTFQAGLGVGSPRFWLFFLSLPPLSVLITWIYNNTGRSTLSAVLVHFSGNLCGALVPKTDRLAGLEVAFLAAAAIALTVVFGPSRLSHR
jgi:membrane protease YdiL (CAAX protease family)